MLSADWTLMIFVWTRCIGIAYFEETIYKDPMSSETFYCRPSQTSVQRLWKLEQSPKPAAMLFANDRCVTCDKYYSLDTKYQSWNLVLKTVLKRHAGTYLCQEMPVGGTDFVTLQKYTLVVNGPPELLPNTPWQKTEQVIEGHTAQLICDVTGSPPPSISWFVQEDGQIRRIYCLNETHWYKRHVHWNNSPEIIIHCIFSAIHIKGPILQIYNITRTCGTQYVCLAENRLSRKPLLNMTYDVDVQFPAQILLYDANSPRRDGTSTILNRKLGIEVILRCDVMMYPEVKIYWKIKNLKNSKLREIASYTPGVGISEQDRRRSVFTFKFQVIPNKKVTIFDIIFRTDQETFSEYVCETERTQFPQFPSTQKSIKIEKLP